MNLIYFYLIEFSRINVLINAGVSVVSFEDLDKTIERMLFRNADGQFQCTECGHVSNQRPNMVNHVESKHVSYPGVECEICGKHIRTRQAYRMHLSRDHQVQPRKKRDN